LTNALLSKNVPANGTQEHERRVLHFDSKSEEIQNDKEAGPLVARTYREHWATPRGRG
jgi:hypothetical protein